VDGQSAPPRQLLSEALEGCLVGLPSNPLVMKKELPAVPRPLRAVQNCKKRILCIRRADTVAKAFLASKQGGTLHCQAVQLYPTFNISHPCYGLYPLKGMSSALDLECMEKMPSAAVSACC
jgi:hypothetical protein